MSQDPSRYRFAIEEPIPWRVATFAIALPLSIIALAVTLGVWW